MKLYFGELSLVLALIILFFLPFTHAIYIDKDDPRYPDVNKYFDLDDPRLNKNEPATYLDPNDPRGYVPLNQLNGVKSTQGNIVLYSSDNSITILPDYLSSRINLMAQMGGDSNGVTWAEINALFPVPDANLSSLSWTKLLNYPTPCGANQAVQVIDDTLTCIDVISQLDANGLYVKLNPTANQTISGDFNLTLGGNLLAPDKNIGTDTNMLNTVNARTLNCANAIQGCILVSANQPIFEVAGSAYQTFKNPERAVVFGRTLAGVKIDTFYIFVSGNSDSTIAMNARTTDATGTLRRSGQLQLKQFTNAEGVDVNQWEYRTVNSGAFIPIGSIQYETFKVLGDVNFNNLTFIRNVNDVNITNETPDGNFTLNVRNANGDLNIGLRMFSGGRLSAPNIKRMNAGGKLPLSYDSNHEIILDTSSASQKLNIENLENIVDTSRISLLKPRTWQDAVWGGQGYGYVAEEVEQIYPELVVRDDSGTILGLDYDSLSIYFSAETQKARQEILVLKNQVADLNAQVTILKQGFCVQFPLNPLCMVVPG